jgi:hypothetical protein
MRDPAIHIRRSELFKILVDFGINDRDMPEIMKRASKINIKNRVNLILPAKSRQKAERIVEANTDLVGTFNLAYMTVMKEENIKVLSIHKNSPQYLSFTEIAQQAKEFCGLFELDYMQGFLIYVRMGVKILNKKYSLYRLKSASDRIVDRYRTIVTVNNDQSPLNTSFMYVAWERAVKKYFDIVLDVKGDMDKYVHFVYAKQDADSVNAKYEDWMNAQFEKWSFLQSMPELSQLHGENAILNYKIFMSKSTELRTESSTEKEYFQAVKEKREIPIKQAKIIR